jgi:hypothetical protein
MTYGKKLIEVALLRKTPIATRRGRNPTAIGILGGCIIGNVESGGANTKGDAAAAQVQL